MGLTNRDRLEFMIHSMSDDQFDKLIHDSDFGVAVDHLVCDWCKTCGFRCREDVECPPFKKYLRSEVFGNGKSIQHESQGPTFNG